MKSPTLVLFCVVIACLLWGLAVPALAGWTEVPALVNVQPGVTPVPTDAEIADIIYTDSEQQGFAEAGVRADSFQPPSATYFRDESSRWLSERIEAQLLGELSRRARAKVDGCKGDIIDCWATASYWLGTTDLGLPLLQQLSTDKALPALECTAAHL